MGFIDSIKEALGGERDESPETPAASGSPVDARHVDRDAPEESSYGPQVTGGKHAARD
jgi:hypothetical protein